MLVGAVPAIPNSATVAVAKIVGMPTNASVLAQIGGGNLATAITGAALATRFVRRDAIVG
jgi:hypothetical protein